MRIIFYVLVTGVSALLLQLMSKADSQATRDTLTQLSSTAAALGIGDKPVKTLNLG